VIIAIGCAAGRIVSKLELPFAAINTDWRELETCAPGRKLPIGQYGYGAGANPVIGAQAAEEAAEAIATLCTEPVLLVAGLGGGTGTGAAPVVARIAKAQGCDVTTVVTWPFPFEARRRAQQARRGQTALQEYVPRIVVVKLCELMPLPPGKRIRDVFEMADHKAASAVIDALRGHGRMTMACEASDGSLFGCCAPSFIDPPIGPLTGGSPPCPLSATSSSSCG
jgi:cell division protein FtsZ